MIVATHPIRRDRPRPAARPLLAVAAVLVLVACTRPAALGWEQVDLCQRPHATDDLLPPQPDGRDLEARIDFELLGQGVLKRLRAMPIGDGSGVPEERLVGGSIRTLSAELDVLIRWQLELGRDPYLSFRPLSPGTDACRLAYRVGVIDPEGVLREAHREEIDPSAIGAPQPVIVDLGAYAGRRIELLATVSPASEETCSEPAVRRAAWGSPVVYSRKETASEVPAEHGSSPPNVVLIGLDTVRADVLGAYGAVPSVTPALDALAAESDLWLEAFSTFNATNPSFSSLMTGLYGKNHGVYDLQTPLPEQHETLAEILRQAGYETGAVLSARHLGARQSGLDQGFDDYILPVGQFAAETSVQTAMSWIADRQGPFFLWLHLFDPHTPHNPPEPYASGYGRGEPQGLDPVFDWQPFRLPGTIRQFSSRTLGAHRALYFGELAYLDDHLGRLFDFLRSRALLDDTLVVVVADHGENLGEYGISYRHSGLWDTTTRVPLMIRWPGPSRQGRRLPGLVQTLDLFPTLLWRLGLEMPETDGRLLAGLEGEGNGGRRVIFAEHSSGHGAMIRSREHLYQRIEGHRLIPDGPQLYDLENDPEQQHNLAGRGLEVEEQLSRTLDAWLAESAPRTARPVSLSVEEIEQLRALGYGGP